MSDLFHARGPIGFERDVLAVIAGHPQHTYQLLTKRSARRARSPINFEWPANLWVGVSVEDQANTSRIDDLRSVPASVRFLSCEPLLGPLPASTSTASAG
jgi:protein gp37